MFTKQPLYSEQRALDARNTKASQDRSDFDLTAVIVNYNGIKVLPRCVSALAGATDNLNAEIVVVDNGSTDGSLEWASQQELLKVIALKRNQGFSKGNNIGSFTAKGDNFLFLNTDCFMKAGSLTRLMETLKSDTSIGIVGPRLLNADGTLQRSCHNFPSPMVFFLEQSMLWQPAARLPYVKKHLQVAGDHNRQRDVNWITGACLLVRGDAFRKVGGFDSNFFFYWEEADLCWKMAEQGWRVVFEPSAEAVHLGGASTTNPDSLVYFFRSLYRFYKKHYAGSALMVTRGIARLMALFKAVRMGTKALTAQGSDAREEAGKAARSWLKVARL